MASQQVEHLAVKDPDSLISDFQVSGGLKHAWQ